MADPENNSLRQYCLLLYAVYAATAFLSFGSTMIVVIATLVLAVAYACGKSLNKVAENTVYASHLRWLARTFWIGSLVYTAFMSISSAYTFSLVNPADFMNAADGGDPDALMAQAQKIAAAGDAKSSMMDTLMLLPPTIWWLWRCWRGFKRAREGMPVENVTTWL